MAPLLAGCSGLGPAVLDVAKAAYGPGKTDLQSQPLNPSLVYLEVAAPRASALLVLAYRDEARKRGANEDADEGADWDRVGAGHDVRKEASLIDTWVSGNGEVLRIQNGLVIGQVGLPDFWPNARPRWQGNTPVDWWVDEPIGTERFIERTTHVQTHIASGQAILPAAISADTAALQPHVRTVKHRLLPVDVVPSQLPQTALLKRAILDSTLQWRAWWSVAEGDALQAQHERLQLVAFDPKNGEVIYGQHCIAKRKCIEFLRRTAQDNR